MTDSPPAGFQPGLGPARRTVREVGLGLITIGVVVLLFVVYQLYGTGLAESSNQAKLGHQFTSVVPTPPSGTVVNPPSSEAGFAFMWHSHNEREITTNNIFPGGMMMMMLVDSREFVIDESQ